MSLASKGTFTMSENAAKYSVNGAAIMMVSLGIIFYCYEYYLRIVPSTISAELKAMYGFSDAALGHLSACFYYAYTLMQIPVGLMMDRFGPRRVLTFACFLCTIGTYLFVGTENFIIAQLGRFLIGIGSAFAYVGVLKISTIWLPSKYFALMASIASGLGTISAIGGQILMTKLINMLGGWQTTLYYAVGLGLFLMILIYAFIQDKGPFTESSSKEENSVWENLKIIVKSPQIWLAGVLGALMYLPLSIFAEMWAIPYLETIGFNKENAAVGSSLVFLGFALGGIVWSLVSDKIGSRRWPLVLGALTSAIFAAFSVFYPSLSSVALFSCLFLIGACSSAQILVFAVGNDLSLPKASGTTTAFVNMVVMFGGVILQPTVGLILDLFSSSASINHTPKDYSVALSVLPLSLFLAGILGFYLIESYKKNKL